MIKFFRKIRQNLLSEGKTTKYFKYALGEILLVVIGILIALWLNNLNQENIERRAETNLLAKVKEENLLNLQGMNQDSTYRAQLPGKVYALQQLLGKEVPEKHRDSIRGYLEEVFRTTTYSFSQANITNYINFQKGKSSEINKELTTLFNLQKDLEFVMEKTLEMKIAYLFDFLKNDIDYNTLEIYDWKTLTSRAFKNNLNLLIGFEEEATIMFNKNLEQMKKVRAMTEKETQKD